MPIRCCLGRGDGAGAAQTESAQGIPGWCLIPSRAFLGVTRIGLCPMSLESQLRWFFCKQSGRTPASRELSALGSRHPLPGCPGAALPRGSKAGRGQRPHSDPVAARLVQPLGGSPVPAPKLSLSPCQALLTGDRQAAETGLAQMGRKVGYLFFLSLHCL